MNTAFEYFSRLLRSLALSAANNGDSSQGGRNEVAGVSTRSETRRSAASATDMHESHSVFAGAPGEDAEVWISSLPAGVDLILARSLLRGHAALKAEFVTFDNIEALKTWIRSQFSMTKETAQEMYCSLLCAKPNMILDDFLILVIRLGKKGGYTESQILAGIRARMPEHLQRQPDFRKLTSYSYLVEFTLRMREQGILRWRIISEKPVKSTRYKKKSAGKQKPVLCATSSDGQITTKAKVNGKKTQMLVDTGANTTFLSEKTAQKAEVEITGETKVNLPDGRAIVCEESKSTVLEVDNAREKSKVVVLPGLPYDGILGMDFMTKSGTIIDTETQSLTTKAGREKRLGGVDMYTVKVTGMDLQDLGEATESIREISSKDEYDIGKSKVGECEIITEGPPQSAYPYQVTKDKEEALEKIMDEMIQRGIVERVRHARWSSPVVLVPKGEGYRMCVDYRALNKVTHTERHPIPIITEVLEQLQGACLFSVLDLTKGFWQIPMEAGSRENIYISRTLLETTTRSC
ncbi:MAG: uncharacterized protein A8A55_3099 [Amphiamblys sp. WSBS2006]|nr:MAG: uncharacterized protein A8A55_3099 [Amphiamblys sp. WSBS2006]